MTPQTIARLGEEYGRHLPRFATQYDGKGGVAHIDHGGIWCSCGEWDSGPRSSARPWKEFNEHVVVALMTHDAMKDERARARRETLTPILKLMSGKTRVGCVSVSNLQRAIEQS